MSRHQSDNRLTEPAANWERGSNGDAEIIPSSDSNNLQLQLVATSEFQARNETSPLTTSTRHQHADVTLAGGAVTLTGKLQPCCRHESRRQYQAGDQQCEQSQAQGDNQLQLDRQFAMVSACGV
jgi:hypothetical protein